MRAETRHQLKQDRFSRATIEAAEKTADWTAENQSKLIVAGVVVAVLVLAAVGSWYYIHQQDQKASVDLGQAVRTLDTFVRQPGAPAEPDFPSFASYQERNTEARKQFQAVMNNYPHTRSADFARYFVGTTSADLGDTAAAERELSAVSDFHNKELAALGKLALASVYRSTNRNKDAIKLYQQLIEKPTTSVGKVTAQMELATTYQADQQPLEAKRIYEEIQKQNPASQAAQMASAKLQELK